MFMARLFCGDVSKKSLEPFLLFGGTPTKAAFVLDPQFEFTRVLSQFRLTRCGTAIFLKFDECRFRERGDLAVLYVHVGCRFQPASHSIMRSCDGLVARLPAIDSKFGG